MQVKVINTVKGMSNSIILKSFYDYLTVLTTSEDATTDTCAVI